MAENKENVLDQEGWKTDGTYPVGKEIYLGYEGISGDGLYAIFDGYNVLIYTRNPDNELVKMMSLPRKACGILNSWMSKLTNLPKS